MSFRYAKRLFSFIGHGCAAGFLVKPKCSHQVSSYDENESTCIASEAIDAFRCEKLLFSGWREVKGTKTLGWLFDCAGYCYTERSNIALLRFEIVN